MEWIPKKLEMFPGIFSTKNVLLMKDDFVKGNEIKNKTWKDEIL